MPAKTKQTYTEPDWKYSALLNSRWVGRHKDPRKAVTLAIQEAQAELGVIVAVLETVDAKN